MHSAQLRSNAPSTLVSSWAQPDSVWFVDLLKVTRCHGIIDPACLDRMRSHLERVALAGREDGSQLQFWQAQKAESAFCSFPARKEICCPFVIEVRGYRINFTQPLCLPCSLFWFISSPTLYEKRQPATKRDVESTWTHAKNFFVGLYDLSS